ncbi:unnamed protein product [Meloidogyne enterolobii]|uniref:Uncharacterized protein n=1 Tax=Meloidogyne enterolobii TaxID=390850 RepID=A0ACB1A586_MELEN
MARPFYYPLLFFILKCQMTDTWLFLPFIIFSHAKIPIFFLEAPSDNIFPPSQSFPLTLHPTSPLFFSINIYTHIFFLLACLC